MSNGVKRLLFLFFCFYFLILIQTGFLIHFNIGGWWAGYGPILIAIIFINLFTPHYSWWGVSASFFGGFFLDIFSENFIGFHILILLLVSLFIKFILKKYMRIPVWEKIKK